MQLLPHIARILFPVDFSGMSTCVVPHVLGIAQKTGAEVVLLNVVPTLWPSGDGLIFHTTQTVETMILQIKETQQRRLTGFQERHFGTVRSQLKVTEGPVAETIVETAKDLNCDLIMMPTRGYGPIRRFLIGSTTSKVLYDSPFNLWTTPHAHDLPPFAPYRQILCAVDLTVPSHGIISQAAQFATLFGSDIHFVNVFDDPTLGPLNGHAMKYMHELKEERSLALRTILHEMQLHGEVSVEAGAVGPTVRTVAETIHADLVIISRGHMHDTLGRLQTHAYEVIWESICPVLTL